MKIWTSQIPEPLPRFELIELGVFKKKVILLEVLSQNH